MKSVVQRVFSSLAVCLVIGFPIVFLVSVSAFEFIQFTGERLAELQEVNAAVDKPTVVDVSEEELVRRFECSCGMPSYLTVKFVGEEAHVGYMVDDVFHVGSMDTELFESLSVDSDFVIYPASLIIEKVDITLWSRSSMRIQRFVVLLLAFFLIAAVIMNLTSISYLMFLNHCSFKDVVLFCFGGRFFTSKYKKLYWSHPDSFISLNDRYYSIREFVAVLKVYWAVSFIAFVFFGAVGFTIMLQNYWIMYFLVVAICILIYIQAILAIDNYPSFSLSDEIFWDRWLLKQTLKSEVPSNVVADPKYRSIFELDMLSDESHELYLGLASSHNGSHSELIDIVQKL